MKEYFVKFLSFFIIDKQKRKDFRKRMNALSSNFIRYSDWVYDLNTNKELFVDNDGLSFKREKGDPKVFAYYLPQFHSIPENDKNFGKGFTEWTNVSQASPQFYGHEQPKIPYDLGFYNLLDIKTIERQAQLASQFGIYGFCFYYYWFNGKKVLNRPIELFKSSSVKLHYHFMWANENWAKLWDGGDKQVILKQEFSEEYIDLFYNDIREYFDDDRYEKIDGKPILAIYRATLFDRSLMWKFVARMNELAIKDGFNGIYFLGTNVANFDKPRDYNFEGVIEFPPHSMKGLFPKKNVEWFNLKSSINVMDMHPWIINKQYLYTPKCSTYKCCFPGWDNTPRKNYSNGYCFYMDGDDFKIWFDDLVQWTVDNYLEDRRYLYINAWNEWAEGAILEPNCRYGYKNLKIIREVLESYQLKNSNS